MSRWSRLAGLGLLVLLSACAQPTSPVAPAGPLDFDTDARVLRGLWAGRSADGHRLLIDAHPSDPNELGYAVEGTFRLDDLEPAVFSGGRPLGRNARRVRCFFSRRLSTRRSTL